MIQNRNSAEVRELEVYLKRILQLATHVSKLLENNKRDAFSVIKGSMTKVTGLAIGRALAYDLWVSLVKKNARWDHKPIIRVLQKNNNGSCNKSMLMPLEFSLDLWSYIHYGFIGRCAGLSPSELKIGIRVYEQFKNSLASMTAEDIMREV